MNEEDFFQLVDDRLEGWEVAELLNLSAFDILIEFKHQLNKKNVRELKELLGIDEDEEEIDNDDELSFDDD